MNTYQKRKEAVSKKMRLLMAIRMNNAYDGYSSYTSGHKKSDRPDIVESAKKELASLVIPEIEYKTIGYSFETKKGDYIGAVYNQDLKDAILEVLDYEKDLKESDLKYKELKEII